MHHMIYISFANESLVDPVEDTSEIRKITIENSLDPGQTRQIVGPDLDPNCFQLWWYSWKNVLKKLNI